MKPLRNRCNRKLMDAPLEVITYLDCAALVAGDFVNMLFIRMFLRLRT